MDVIQRRKPLLRLRKAVMSGSVTAGFIGGSITDQKSGRNWPDYVGAWFREHVPGLRITMENTAIGATGSELAVFRAERDLIQRECDLVCIEFAVNDRHQPLDKQMRTREGLIRKLLAAEIDIVLVYAFCQDMYHEMIHNRIPETIAGFEKLAAYYGICSVWMGLYALEEVQRGGMKWEEWLPDGLHPDYRGSYSYAQSVIRLFEKELDLKPPDPVNICAGASGQEPAPASLTMVPGKIPPPLESGCWERTAVLPFSEVVLDGPWIIQRWSRMAWVDQVLETSAVGARMSFVFRGRGLALGFDFGRYSSEFRYRIDQGQWVDAVRERPGWCPDSGWYRVTTLADDLPSERHSFELIVIHGNTEECKGTHFRLALIGIIL